MKATRDVGDASVMEYVQVCFSAPSCYPLAHANPSAQDPDVATNSGTPNFLLKIDNDTELLFTFTFIIRPTQLPPSGPDDTPAVVDTVINGLTYVAASTAKEVENLVTLEFHADPNLHKNANVQLVGDFATSGQKSVTFEWQWKWRPPKAQEDRGAGWRNCCSFVEYDQRAHRLNTLATFSFWVSNGYANFQGSNPNSPMFNLSAPPRIRIPSSQSVGSRGNPSEYEDIPSPVVDYGGENLMVPPQSSGSMSRVETSLQPPPLSEQKKVDVQCQRPGEDLSSQEDGPVFRATMRALEMKTGAMRQRMKKVLRRAQDAHQAQMVCNNAISDLIEAIREASASNANAVQPAMDHYFDKIAKEILAYEKRNARNLQVSIIEPLSKVYEQDIKKAETKKKDFEDHSSDYYAYLSRYLGQKQDAKERKKEESDAKYQTKRRTFELKRFDYGCFMQDLHGGRKEQEVLSWLTRYADGQTKGFLNTAERVKELVPELVALSTEVEEADKAFRFTRTEREERRRTIEMSTTDYRAPDAAPIKQTSNGQATSYISDSDLLQRRSSTRHGNSLAPSRTKTDGARTPNSESAPMISPREQAPNKFQGIRDLEDPDHTSGNGGIERKEGLLFALSKPGSHVDTKGLNKTAWHKFWIVLDQGKLSEYSNWKDQLDLHMEPIDLRLATVREARGQERRFCFEVVTPNFTRVYQGQSEEDARSWMRAVSNALQSAMEGRGATQGLPSRTGSGNKHEATNPGLVRGVGRDIGSILTGKSSSTNHNNNTSSQTIGNSASNKNDIFRRTTVGGGRPSYGGRRESNHTSSEHSSDHEPADRLLQELREREEGNKWCADCGSGVKTEWVSLNLGVVLCIECSGIHRSLGTHVSKVRSLTLDFRGFTNDIVALLRVVGNTVSNSVYEATLSQYADTQQPGMVKPQPNATRDQRLHFITRKYVDRAFVAPLHPTLSPFATAEELLLTSIKKNDIKGVLHALALRASPNACDKSRGTHAVFLALAAADPGAPSGGMSLRPITAGGSTSRSVSTGSVAQAGTEKTTFPVAEVLVLNGADVPAIGPPFPLGAGASVWLEAKRSRESAQKLEHTTSAAGSTTNYLGGMGSGNMGQGGMAGIAGGQSERERKEARLQKRVSAGGRLVGLGRS